MGMECSIRTDLAVETQESLKKTNSNLRGVNYSEEKRKDDIKVSVVTIETENASKLTGRPRGRYVTIEAPQMTEDDELYRKSGVKDRSIYRPDQRIPEDVKGRDSDQGCDRGNP